MLTKEASLMDYIITNLLVNYKNERILSTNSNFVINLDAFFNTQIIDVPLSRSIVFTHAQIIERRFER